MAKINRKNWKISYTTTKKYISYYINIVYKLNHKLAICFFHFRAFT